MAKIYQNFFYADITIHTPIESPSRVYSKYFVFRNIYINFWSKKAYKQCKNTYFLMSFWKIFSIRLWSGCVLAFKSSVIKHSPERWTVVKTSGKKWNLMFFTEYRRIFTVKSRSHNKKVKLTMHFYKNNCFEDPATQFRRLLILDRLRESLNLRATIAE